MMREACTVSKPDTFVHYHNLSLLLLTVTRSTAYAVGATEDSNNDSSSGVYGTVGGPI